MNLIHLCNTEIPATCAWIQSDATGGGGTATRGRGVTTGGGGAARGGGVAGGAFSLLD